MVYILKKMIKFAIYAPSFLWGRATSVYLDSQLKMKFYEHYEETVDLD